MGSKRYNLTSPEEKIYCGVIDTLKEYDEIADLNFYIYDPRTDDVIDTSVPPQGSLPCLRLLVDPEDIFEETNKRQESNLNFVLETWLVSDSIFDCMGIMYAVFKALYNTAFSDIEFQPRVVTITSNTIEHVAEGYTRCMQTIVVNTRIKHPK